MSSLGPVAVWWRRLSWPRRAAVVIALMIDGALVVLAWDLSPDVAVAGYATAAAGLAVRAGIRAAVRRGRQA